MRFLLFSIVLFCGHLVLSQEDTVMRTQNIPAVRYDKKFDLHYRQALNRIRRTYPLAIYAQTVLDSLDTELASVTKKRKQKKLAKSRKKDLEEELEYLIKDLYVDEGAMLFKLIHRQTDMTVTEILEKYRGKVYAKSVQATFAMWGHDTQSRFDAEGEDWIAELVIQDIEAGRIKVDLSVTPMSKEEFKEGMKQYRKTHREYRRSKRKSK